MIPITSIGPSGIGGYCQNELSGAPSTFTLPSDVRVKSRIDGRVWLVEVSCEADGEGICNAVADNARRSTAYFEGFCFGVGIGMVVLALLGWMVS